MTSGCSPGWRAVTLAGVVLSLVGEVGDKLGSLCQVAAPDRIGMEREWNAREPGQRTWVGWCEPCEAPIEDGGHVACGFELASGGGRQQVAKWVLARFGREGDQVGSQGRPGRFVGESGDVLVGLVRAPPPSGVRRAVRLRRGGRRCSAGPHGKSRAVGLLSSRSKVLAETGASSRARICCRISVGVRGEVVSGRMTVWGSPSPTTWR